MRRLFGRIFPQRSDLGTLLHATSLTVLSERRHLLMHRAGTIDDSYIKKNGEDVPVGNSLIVTPRDVVCGFRTVVETGACLARAFDACL